MKRTHSEEDLGHSNKKGKSIESVCAGKIKDQNVEIQDTSYHIVVDKNLSYVCSEEREIQFNFLCPTKKMDLVTQEYQRIERETQTRISINPFDVDHECITVTSIEELELAASPVFTAATQIASKCWVKPGLGRYHLKMVLTDSQQQCFDAYTHTAEYIVGGRHMKSVKKDDKNLLEFGGYFGELRINYEKVLLMLRIDAFKLSKGKSIESDGKWPHGKDETLLRLSNNGVNMQMISEMLKEPPEACTNRLTELGKVSVCAGKNEDDSIRRDIEFHILCPTAKMELDTKEYQRIERETQTCISINPYDVDHVCITVTSIGELELAASPAFRAASLIASKCWDTSGSSDCYRLRMLLTDSEEQCLDVCRNTGGPMKSVKKDDKYLLEFGGYLGQLKSNYERVLLMLRKNFFKVPK